LSVAQQKVRFFFENVNFKLNHAQKMKTWIGRCLKQEGKNQWEINYIFCDDNYLLQLNQDYLSHDTLTDIITFDYENESLLQADAFISVERVKENALERKIPIEKELARVIIHGVLHLLGYNDHRPKEKAVIRAKEDFYLALLFDKKAKIVPRET